MYPGQNFKVVEKKLASDGKGGKIQTLSDTGIVLHGYLDLLSGTNRSLTSQNAIVEESTHVLVVPKYRDDLRDRQFIEDPKGQLFKITYIDDPVGVNHHLEIYLSLERDLHEY